MVSHDDITMALDRLFHVAKSDSGQSARVANFLLAWWDGNTWGHFPIADLFGLDQKVAADVATVFTYIAEYPDAVYADSFGYRQSMVDLIDLWRN